MVDDVAHCSRSPTPTGLTTDSTTPVCAACENKSMEAADGEALQDCGGGGEEEEEEEVIEAGGRAPGWALASLSPSPTAAAVDELSQARAALAAQAHLTRATARWVRAGGSVARLVAGVEAERARMALAEAERGFERLCAAQAEAAAALPSWLDEAESVLDSSSPSSAAPAVQQELARLEQMLSEREDEIQRALAARGAAELHAAELQARLEGQARAIAARDEELAAQTERFEAARRLVLEERDAMCAAAEAAQAAATTSDAALRKANLSHQRAEQAWVRERRKQEAWTAAERMAHRSLVRKRMDAIETLEAQLSEKESMLQQARADVDAASNTGASPSAASCEEAEVAAAERMRTAVAHSDAREASHLARCAVLTALAAAAEAAAKEAEARAVALQRRQSGGTAGLAMPMAEAVVDESPAAGRSFLSASPSDSTATADSHARCTPARVEHAQSAGETPRPLWTPDWASEQCEAQGCTSGPFNVIWNRRHHCRSCGGLFCDSCSSVRIPLPHLGYEEPQRVCEGCRMTMAYRDAD